MSRPLETGNPVFDYRADFRRGAAAVQLLLIVIGAIVVIASGLFWLTASALATTAKPGELFPWPFYAAITCKITLIAGGGTMITGLIWGYYWRDLMRAEFQRKYGTAPTMNNDK